jgi:hypothetical protein
MVGRPHGVGGYHPAGSQQKTLRQHTCPVVHPEGIRQLEVNIYGRRTDSQKETDN